VVVFIACVADPLTTTPGTMNTPAGRATMPIHDRTAALR
jgi:hypothetical protein